MTWMPLKVYKNCWRFWVFSTFTFAEIAALCGDICPRAIHSFPLWSWIRARASTCSVSPSTRHATWLPWRPLTPTTIYWWLKETTHALKWHIKRQRLLFKRCSRMTAETCVAFIQYSNCVRVSVLDPLNLKICFSRKLSSINNIPKMSKSQQNWPEHRQLLVILHCKMNAKSNLRW